MPIKMLSQRNPNWAEKRIGASTLTLGRWGCTTTCVSMLSDYFGHFETPAQIASVKSYFTLNGLIIWKNLNIPGMKFFWRYYGRNDTAIRLSLSGPNSAVMLQVNNGQHWIVVLRKTWFKNDYLCVDPWNAKTCTAIADYKNITGSSHFIRA
jgi:hypothetical protein